MRWMFLTIWKRPGSWSGILSQRSIRIQSVEQPYSPRCSRGTNAFRRNHSRRGRGGQAIGFLGRGRASRYGLQTTLMQEITRRSTATSAHQLWGSGAKKASQLPSLLHFLTEQSKRQRSLSRAVQCCRRSCNCRHRRQSRVRQSAARIVHELGVTRRMRSRSGMRGMGCH